MRIYLGTTGINAEAWESRKQWEGPLKHGGKHLGTELVTQIVVRSI